MKTQNEGELLVIGNKACKLLQHNQAQKIINYYQYIRHLSAVPEMWLEGDALCYKWIPGQTLLSAYAEGVELEHYRQQMIDFMVGLNRAGFAHRDLNPKNVILSERLWIIDWDYLIPNQVPLSEAYDLTGLGLPDPGRTNYIHIFRSFEIYSLPDDVLNTIDHLPYYNSVGVIPSVAKMLGISMDAFE